MELVSATYVYISYVNIFCQRALLWYTNIVDKFSRSAKFTEIFQYWFTDLMWKQVQ